MIFTELESLEQFDDHIKQKKPLTNIVFQSLDLGSYGDYLKKTDIDNVLFLGCRLTPEILDAVISKGALVFPRLKNVPYNSYRNSLYSPSELMRGFEVGNKESLGSMLDVKIYDHFVSTGKAEPVSIVEALARRLHDHAITDALEEFIDGRSVVAIMGGHSMMRDEESYSSVAKISKELTECGYLLASGGGPGAMEATHLGAWMAHRTDKDVNDAVGILSKAPFYTPMDKWMETALEVKRKYPLMEINGKLPQSLGIPTWLYGHEPPTKFATHIAKYFANSVREDGLLAIAKNGVIFAPGRIGTIQEIFQDAAQNHYKTVGVISPMVFFNRQYWCEEKPVYPLLKQLSEDEEYGRLVNIADTVEEVLSHIKSFNLET